jgi:hypothetical protein
MYVTLCFARLLGPVHVKRNVGFNYMMWYICLLQLGWHPVAAVQNTITHQQYTAQHNGTEHTEYYVRNNKNTQT